MKFKQNNILYFLLVLFLLGCKNSEKSETEKESKNNDSYVLDKDWPKLPDDFNLGSPTGLGLDTKGNIIAFHRSGRTWDTDIITDLSLIGENTISTIDAKTGEILKSWGKNLCIN